MRTVMVLALLLCAGCAKGSNDSDSGASAKSIPDQCGTPTTVTHDFVHWDSETSQDYNCPGLFDKMNCHLYRGTDHSEAICETISSGDPQTPPVDTATVDPYAQGLHHFLIDDSYGAADAYDLGEGTYFGGLRCFYFVDLATFTKEDIICSDDNY